MILMNSYFSQSYGRSKFGTIYFCKWFRHKSWTQLQTYLYRHTVVRQGQSIPYLRPVIIGFLTWRPLVQSRLILCETCGEQSSTGTILCQISDLGLPSQLKCYSDTLIIQ